MSYDWLFILHSTYIEISLLNGIIIPRTMIPACGTAPEHAGNPFIYGEFPQVPMLFRSEPTRKIFVTWQQYSGRKNFVPEDARFRHFPDAGNEEEIDGISEETAKILSREIPGTYRILTERTRIPIHHLLTYRISSCH